MEITKATQEDLAELAQLQVLMAKETENMALNIEIVNKGVQGLFNDPSMGYYLLAKNEKGIMGSLMVLYEWSDWRAGKVLWVHSVYIKKEFRQKGIYKSMYDYLQNIVKNDSSLFGIRLYVDKTNESAQKVYQKLEMDNSHYDLYEWLK